MSDFRCWQCGADLDEMILPVSRREECRQCRAEIHVCRMCVNYHPHVSDQCREDRAEPPSDKEHANFCDYFKPDPSAYEPGDDAGQKARDALESLFGDTGGKEGGDESSANPLDDLFDLPKDED